MNHVFYSSALSKLIDRLFNSVRSSLVRRGHPFFLFHAAARSFSWWRKIYRPIYRAGVKKKHGCCGSRKSWWDDDKTLGSRIELPRTSQAYGNHPQNIEVHCKRQPGPLCHPVLITSKSFRPGSGSERNGSI